MLDESNHGVGDVYASMMFDCAGFDQARQTYGRRNA